jgi:phage/plasmid-like protein (TIGR03299 family)
MSAETEEWLNTMTLIGCTDKRGNAWHYRESAQGAEPNHYPGFIPVEDVLRRLFSWSPIEEAIYRKVIDPSKGEVFVALNDRKAIYRSDQPHGLDALGVFRSGYEPHPYDVWLLEVVAEILSTDLGISSAGLLQKGAVAWVEVSVPDNMKTPEGVEFRPNLLAGTSFNGSLSTTYIRTIGETVCDNTMSANLNEKTNQQLKIRHSKYSGLHIADAQHALELAENSAERFEDTVKQLCNITVSDAEFDAFLDATTPIPEKSGRGATLAGTKRDVLTQLYTNDSRVNPWTGTAFGVLQMDNTYRHHYTMVRGADGGRAERNAANALSGATAERDDEVLHILAKIKGVESLLVAA